MEALSFTKMFVLYIDHQALQYLSSQVTFNRRHMKWVKFLQSYTFVLKHRSEKSSKVANAFSRKQNLLIEMQVEVFGFDELKELYNEDLDFSEVWKACKDTIAANRTRWLDYLIKMVCCLKVTSYVFQKVL